MTAFRPLNIRDNIRWLSEKIHVAGTDENTELMKKIAAKVSKRHQTRVVFCFHFLIREGIE